MYYIGIDLGGTFIKGGLTDHDGKIIIKKSIPTGAYRPYDQITKDMAILAKSLIEEASLGIKDIKSIGIGSPGTPDNKKGTLVYANNIDSFLNVPLRNEILKHINTEVILDNDANCAALAESIAGAARNCSSSITITLGTGLGSGVIINNKIYSGINYSAAEMGHMVIQMNGEDCTCGRKGCWEAYASGSALIRHTKNAALNNPDSIIHKLVEGDLNRIDAKTAFDAAKAGDNTGVEIVDNFITYLAEGLINAINIFAPEVIVIGGGISREGEYLLAPLRKKIREWVYFKEEPQTLIKQAEMGNDAGIIGAAMLGRIA